MIFPEKFRAKTIITAMELLGTDILKIQISIWPMKELKISKNQ